VKTHGKNHDTETAVVSTCEVDISELVTPFVETTIPVEAWWSFLAVETTVFYGINGIKYW